MNLKVLEKPSVIKSWLFPLTFSCFWKFRLLLYVFKKSCDVCKSKRFQITRDVQIYLQSKLALSVLLRMANLQISHIINFLFYVIFVIFFHTFWGNLWNNHKNILYSFWQRFAVAVQDQNNYYFNLSICHMTYANTYAHTRNKSTFLTSNYRLNFIAKVHDLWTTRSCWRVSSFYTVEAFCSVSFQPWTWRCSKRKLKEIHLLC